MIIFCDFDRTFYFERDTARTEANLVAVQKWKSAGNQFCIATGRSWGSFNHQYHKLAQLCDYMILDGGSLIYNSEGMIYNIFAFSSEVLDEIEETTSKVSCVFRTLYFTPDYEGFEPQAENVTKIRLWFKEFAEAKVGLKMFERLPLFAFICRSSGNSRHQELDGFTCFVELIPKDSGKAKAIEVLALKEGLTLKEIIVVGDSGNDYDAIKRYDGYMIAGSDLARDGSPFKVVESLAGLIDNML